MEDGKMLQNLKKFLYLSSVTTIILSFFLSCENPFSANLGGKVDIEAPIVRVFSPVSGGFIRGVALFEGKATAYRSLKRVEYKIFANDATGQALVDWREVSYGKIANSREREWYLDLDTSRLNRGNDGSIKMQFRAIDDSQSGETVEFVYIVKNKPSVINMTLPSEDLKNANTTPRLVAGTSIIGNIIDRKGLKPGFPQIKIWPDSLGYEPDPNDNYSDVANVNWGWASLYLPGVGNADVGYDYLEGPEGGSAPQGTYADRTRMGPVRVAQFAFKLDKFTVVPDPDNPDIRRIVYETDGAGNRQIMDPGKLYYFRIRTSDTEAYDENDPERPKLPVAPDHPLFSENLVGYFPPLNYGETNENPFRKRSDPVKLSLISDAVPPEILLDNSDVESTAGWNKKPHRYINEPTVKKIAVEDPTEEGLFRLRVRGVHPDGIAMATLKYTHDASNSEGYLKWDDDDPESRGYVSVESESEKAKQGHKGVYVDPNIPNNGTIFTFTATKENLKDIVTGNSIFTTSSGPYILEVVVTAGSNSVNTAKYVVYMDGKGPDVSIQEIVGASTEIKQIASSVQEKLKEYAAPAGGVIDGNTFTVNNNIQVVVSRSDDSGIMENLNPDSTNPDEPWITPAPGRINVNLPVRTKPVTDLPMVKWVVEIAGDDDDVYFNKNSNPDTTYQKLLAYRENPTAANLKFFNDITDATAAESPAMSGWVNPPKTAETAVKPADMRHNFKFNTNNAKFNGKDLWVYVIAQDTVQNLGFVMQKIYVDQESDRPRLLDGDALSDNNAGGVPIAGPDNLNVTVSDTRPNPTLGGNIKSNFKNNVLEENQPIDLSVADYDGIDRKTGISITIFDLNGLKNAAGTDLSGTLSGAVIEEVLKTGNKNNWEGNLTQQLMATTLYGNLPAAQRPNPLPVHLYDGMYRIEISYSDDVNEKVAITLADRPGVTTLQQGDTPVSVPGKFNPKIFYFAVNAEPERPQIFVDSVEENQMQSDLPVRVSGRVRSRLKVQRLWITFTPDIISVPPEDYNSKRTVEITELFPNDQFTPAQAIPQTQFLNHEGKDADGYYIYYWKRDNVVFQPSGNSYLPAQDNRRFTLEAWDRLGNKNTYTRTVLVDNDPPKVNVVFNYGRPNTNEVNGKAPFTVTATDNNKIAEYPSDRPNDPYSGVKWWVLPVGFDMTDFKWETDFGNSAATGTGGQFYTSQEVSGGRFTAVINTTTLTNLAEYKLYVMVRDSAGNTTALLAVPSFRVDQEKDYPVINTDSLKPQMGAIMGNTNISISGGLASDDDGFDRTKLEAVTVPAVNGTGYVRIRFPATWNTTTGAPLTWGSWISVPGTLNGEGAIRFNFKIDDLTNGIANTVFNGYFNFDGTKHYQIQVTDEAVAGTSDRPPGKNPDGEQPGGPTYLGPVSRIFPVPGGLTNTYNFVMDTRPPEIFFDKYDPTSGHPNFNSIMPAYSSFDLLVADLKGRVEENNLESLSINWNDTRKTIKNKDSPSTVNAAGIRSFTWNITDPDLNDPKTELAEFKKKFDEAAQGQHSITLAAKDTANNSTSVLWTFLKDTEGPEISVNSIRRVIKHTSLPVADNFPANWPLDWPYGTEWKNSTDTKWVALRNTYGVADWPSEYAYFTDTRDSQGTVTETKVTKVIKALTAENEKVNASVTGREISVISGPAADVSIKGSFSDALSDIWADISVPPVFFYRFHKEGDTNTGRNTAPSVTTGWIRGTCEPMAPGKTNTNSADWIIPLTADGGFTFADGEHTFDIGLQDKAGNWSDIYGLRFIVDRNDPLLLGYNATGTAVETVPPRPFPADWTPGTPHSFKVEGGGVTRPLAENERVFSAANAAQDGLGTVFSLKGFVRDNNLSELIVVISSEGANPYTVTANVKVGAWVSGGSEVSSANDTDGRLIVKPTTVSDEKEWAWTLNILQKDVFELRKQGNDGTRRYITVTAVDKANRKAGPQRWNFYLDSTQPVIEYANLEKGPNFTVNPNNISNIILQGTASDDTKIQNVRYSLAKWNYATKAWEWYNGTAWTSTQPANPENWPSMLDRNYGPANATSTVNWTLNNTKLLDAGYPQNLFQTEGMYRLDLYVTDYSLSSDPTVKGNPNNTALVIDDTFADVGGVSGRKFFVDSADPNVGEDEEQTYKTYYRSDNLEFKFTAGDANTVTSVTARIKDNAGNYLTYPVSVTPNPLTGTLNAGQWVYDITVKPEMPSIELGNFTLEITVKDGAGKETNTTKQFTLDNKKPELAFTSPEGGNEAVTGRVVIRGKTDENSNLIKKVAFYVAQAPGYGPPPAYTGDPAIDTPNGWRFDNAAPGDPSDLSVGGTKLIQIMPGTFTWEIKTNTRNFNVSSEPGKYVEWMQIGKDAETTGLTYLKKRITTPGEDVGRMKLYIVAEDEAGNVGGIGANGAIEPMVYWLYPEGDRPVVTRISNPDDTKIEAERLLNGRIRVAGMAIDNERVKWVWFRVLNENGKPYTEADRNPFSVYSWNTETWEIATDAELAAGGDKVIDNRRSQQLIDELGRDLGTGWYRANGGGSPNVSWYTYINMEGELEPETAGANKITIEVRAEDATRNDLDVWVTSGRGMVSRDKGDPDAIPPRDHPKDGLGNLVNIGNTVTALVVQGAPIFENEEVKTGRSSEGSESDWGSIVTKSLSKRASYRIIVKDDSGVGAIRWTRTQWNGTAFQNVGTINLLDPNNTYNTRTGAGNETYAGHLTRMDTSPYDPTTNPGIAVKAEPNPARLKKSGTLTAGTYLIWEPGTGYQDYIPAGTTPNHNVRYTTFKADAGFTLGGSDAQLIEQAADGNFEWLVTVDVNTAILDNGRYAAGETASYQYPLNLSATDISKATPLTTNHTASLPIDNRPPKGSYTINTRPAGQAATIGGEAGDEGPVNGVSKVVIWFSRKINGNDTRVSWHENGVRNVHGEELVGGNPPSGWKLDPVPANAFKNDTVPITVTKIGSDGKPVTDTNFFLPLIPTNPAAGTGGDYAIVIDRNDQSGRDSHHGHNLPMGLSTGGMGKIWYVEINSFGLVSGPVYIHYVVYDTAGNASYFKERLVVMNYAPQIARIKLGTDIRDNSDLRSGGNVASATGGLAEDDGTIPLNIIRKAVPLGTTDVQKGITDYISTIRTAETGAIRQVDFNARNKLLALRVETTLQPGDQKTRNFRFEYVSGAEKLDNATAKKLTAIKAGKVYVIDDPGNARWGAVGAPDVSYTRGLAFMASLDGIDNETSLARGELDTAAGSVWELNNTYPAIGAQTASPVPAGLRIGDAGYPLLATVPEDYARNAEFVYKEGAFGTTSGSTIVDNPAVGTIQPNINPSTGNSLFILKIFDGDEEDVFADFALLSFRVNNNDVTRPDSQLYDLNPMTEGQAQPQIVARSLNPMGIGLNRTRGGLWNTDTTAKTVAKPGHIEPRKTTSLTSTQMGGASTLARNTVDQPYANPLAFYNVDTVSGRVVLRGYAEDDQRVNRIDLIFTDAANTVTILDRSVTSPATAPDASAGIPGRYEPATTGLLKVAAASTGRVYYTDDIDLYRHRVEWAYIWDTETLPANLVVGSTNVRAVVYNDNSAAANPASAVKASVETQAPATGSAGTLNNYNRIQINIRPYITGFMRNQSQFFHNTRSRQGWYAFSREERIVIAGYNLGRNGLTTSILLPGVAAANNARVTDAAGAEGTSHGLGADAANVARYRAYTVPVATTPGTVTLTVGDFQAVNNYTNTNGNDRPKLNAEGTAVNNNGRFWVQPWNTEYSQGKEGSDLWDDFTSVHIWQSNDYRPDTVPAGEEGRNHGAFPTRRNNWTYSNPAMSMDPSNGALYASQNEHGAGSGANSGTTMVSNNYSSWTGNPRGSVTQVTQFIDPIFFSDIYMLPSNNATPQANNTAWVSQSLIGRAGVYMSWRNNAGMWITGPDGANADLSTGLGANARQYHGESTWYNVSTASPTGPTQSNPQYSPYTDQFSNTHIIAVVTGGNTNIHASYYDTKDSSLKYRYNLRGAPGTVNGGTNGGSETNAGPNNDVPKMWTNLDGGFDTDDTTATGAAFINTTISNLAGAGNTTAIAANARVVNYNTRNGVAVANRIAAGEHNAIAVTSQGYPVIAYFDATNQKLKLAVSNRVAPVLANSWTIRDNVIPTGDLSHYGTGEYVSIAIDTQTGTNQNRIHIAALNSVKKNLVYITGMLNPTGTGDAVLTGVTVQVVDSVGSVGRWCDISLDDAGNPWIAYQDESYRGSMDGVRMAYLNTTAYTKALNDINGASIRGWETMNVPARFQVQDARIQIESFPARNFAPTGNSTKFWKAAVAYPSTDLFRLAYYVK
jgi:hypothetical protein